MQEPNQNDWEKGRRLVKYLKESRNLHLVAFLKEIIDDYRILGISEKDELRMMSLVDAAYGVHAEMKSHLSAQKLNVKSSTEAELVAVSKYLPYVEKFY